MKFEGMMLLLKNGYAMRLPEWDRSEFIYYVNGSVVEKSNLRGEAAKQQKFMGVYSTVSINPHIDRYSDKNGIQVGYNFSLSELESDQWEVYKLNDRSVR